MNYHILRYDPKYFHGKTSTLERYKNEEAAVLKVINIRENYFNGQNVFSLQSYGLVGWVMITNLSVNEVEKL